MEQGTTHGTSHGAPAPEFSRLVVADRMPRDEVVEEIAATEAERRALAARFELEAIDRLEATVRLRRTGGDMVRVTGELRADVVQTCVVTLEPVRNAVAERFEALFAPESLVPEDGDEVEIDFDAAALDEDVPEAMDRGRIDIGELVAQHLSLALDPYPRAPGVALPDAGEEEAPADAKPNPFAVLERLKRPH
ncbi:YceD family protein [Azospirillum sp. ST 5-10]